MENRHESPLKLQMAINDGFKIYYFLLLLDKQSLVMQSYINNTLYMCQVFPFLSI